MATGTNEDKLDRIIEQNDLIIEQQEEIIELLIERGISGPGFGVERAFDFDE